MNRISSQLARWAAALKQQTLIVYFAARDPRTPFLVRLLALLVAAYALSPIDLIPDFIPIIGYLDDLILLPLGIALIVKLTPDDVIAAAREKATVLAEKPTSKLAAFAIVALWILAIWLVGKWLITRFTL